MSVALSQKAHIGQLTQKGDYCFVKGAVGTEDNVVLSCPFCCALMVLFHKIVSRTPLVVTPSIVGPRNANQHENCQHHFMIEKGQASL